MARTLVIQPLPGIGDMVWHLPHLETIAQATNERRITVMTKRRSRADELFASTAYVDRVLWLDRAQGDDPAGRHDGVLGAWRLGQDLKGGGFETVWILHGSSRYALAAMIAGIGERIGFGIGWQNAFLTSPFVLARSEAALHPVEKAMRLLRRHSLSIEPTPHYTPDARACARITTELGTYPRPWMALGIGASEPFKQWGAQPFAALTRAFVDRTGGTVFLIGGPAEDPLAADIESRARDHVVRALARPLDEAAALARAADVFVGNDTGLLNLAAATGGTTIGLFGGSAPLTLYPNLVALEPEGGAVYRENRMDGISVETVMAAIGVALG